MDYRRFGNTVVVRIDRYEEVMEKLAEICEKEGILLGSISGLGAASFRNSARKHLRPRSCQLRGDGAVRCGEKGIYRDNSGTAAGSDVSDRKRHRNGRKAISPCAYRRGGRHRKSLRRASEEVCDRRHSRNFHSCSGRTCGPQGGLVFGNGTKFISF